MRKVSSARAQSGALDAGSGARRVLQDLSSACQALVVRG